MRSCTLVGLAAVVLWTAGCGGSDSLPSTSIRGSLQEPGTEKSAEAHEPLRLTPDNVTTESPARRFELHPEVILATSLGEIRVRLNSEKAPRTVENFLLNYVDRGFYDQTIFHYVDQGFMIAGGGYTADLQPKETRTPILNEADNGLKNTHGTIGMARHPDYINSATSQFYINLVDNPSLDYAANEEGEVNGYCVFGEIIDGMEVVDKIAATAVHDVDQFPKTPTAPLVILSITRAR